MTRAAATMNSVTSLECWERAPQKICSGNSIPSESVSGMKINKYAQPLSHISLLMLCASTEHWVWSVMWDLVLSCSPHYFFFLRQDLSLNLDLTNSARLAGRHPQKSLISASPALFAWMLGLWTQVQSLYGNTLQTPTFRFKTNWSAMWFFAYQFIQTLRYMS